MGPLRALGATGFADVARWDFLRAQGSCRAPNALYNACNDQ